MSSCLSSSNMILCNRKRADTPHILKRKLESSSLPMPLDQRRYDQQVSYGESTFWEGKKIILINEMGSLICSYIHCYHDWEAHIFLLKKEICLLLLNKSGLPFIKWRRSEPRILWKIGFFWIWYDMIYECNHIIDITVQLLQLKRWHG